MVLNNRITTLYETFKIKTGCVDDNEAMEMLLSRYKNLKDENQKLRIHCVAKDKKIKILSTQLAEIVALIDNLDKGE